MKWRIWLQIGLGVLLAVIALAVTAFFYPQQVLTMDTGPVRADVLVVLGGGGLERPARAAELFKDGAAPLVICTGSGDAGPHKAWLVAAGIPAAAIKLEARSINTRENALFTINQMRAQHLQSAIIVTSWYHSRRALACFEHYGPDLKFYSRPAYYGWNESGGDFRYLKRYIRAEYFKLVGYWVFYGVCPV